MPAAVWEFSTRQSRGNRLAVPHTVQSCVRCDRVEPTANPCLTIPPPPPPQTHPPITPCFSHTLLVVLHLCPRIKTLGDALFACNAFGARVPVVVPYSCTNMTPHASYIRGQRSSRGISRHHDKNYCSSETDTTTKIVVRRSPPDQGGDRSITPTVRCLALNASLLERPSTKQQVLLNVMILLLILLL